MKQFASVGPLLLILFFLFSSHTTKQHNSLPFEVKTSGHGKKSILLLPGFACSGDVWNETRVVLEKEYTCYTFTMAGFAGVTPQPNASFKNWEKAIAQFIEQNKIDKPVIIGHSMGGAWPWRLLQTIPIL